ncbi:MAG: hypothetical protein ACKO7O_05810 [Bacteroidota bacterium]
MKTLAYLLAFLSFSVTAQRNEEDRINLLKVEEVKKLVNTKLSGSVSAKDVEELAKYLWESRPPTNRFQYFDLINKHLVEMDNDPNQKVDDVYLNQAFTELKNKDNVKVELVKIIDWFDFYVEENKKSDYLIEFKIHFINETSFGKATKNFIDFKVDVINGYVTSVFYIQDKV